MRVGFIGAGQCRRQSWPDAARTGVDLGWSTIWNPGAHGAAAGGPGSRSGGADPGANGGATGDNSIINHAAQPGGPAPAAIEGPDGGCCQASGRASILVR